MQAWYVRMAERQQFVDRTLMALVHAEAAQSAESPETFSIRLHMAILSRYQAQALGASDESVRLLSERLLRELGEKIAEFARGPEEETLLMEMVRERIDHPISHWVRSSYNRAESEDPQRFLTAALRESSIEA